MVNSGPGKIVVESSAPRGLKVGPEKGKKIFSLLSNSPIFASGNAEQYKGIRLIVDGKGRSGKIKVSFLKDSGCPDVVEYAATADYAEEHTVIDLDWTDFTNAKAPETLPYPFDALRLDGERSDSSAIVIEEITLRR